MAVNTMDAPRRRLVFGFNVFVQAVLAVLIVLVVIWIAGRDQLKHSADWTGSGSNSLSDRTVKLLKGLNESIHITAIYPEPEKRDEAGLKRRRQVQDLLDLYRTAGGARITTAMIDPAANKGDTDKLLKRLRELPAYKDEAKPHAEAMKQTGPLMTSIGSLADGELRSLKSLVKDTPLDRDRNLAIIAANFQAFSEETQRLNDKLKEATEGDVPQYGAAVKALREYAGSVQAALESTAKWMASDGQTLAGATEEIKNFFRTANERYQPVLTQTRELTEKTKDLKEVKLEQLYKELSPPGGGPPVLVESEHEARVVPTHEMWTRPIEDNSFNPDSEHMLFNGEASLSSAILALTKPDKTAVIFVRFGGEALLRPDMSKINVQQLRELPRAPFGQLANMLEKANFVTAEWDVQASKTPPPVEKASRSIYVVLPPEPPPQRNMMQQMPPPSMTPADRKLVLDAVDAAGMAVFLAGWEPPTNPYGMDAGYQYADYLRSEWGIDVLSNELALRFIPMGDRKDQWGVSRESIILATGSGDPVRFTDHAIASASKSDRAGFPQASPLKILNAESRPAGEKIDVLVETLKSQDLWATSDIMGLQTQLNKGKGVKPDEKAHFGPFPIAVAAERAGSSGPSPAPNAGPATRRIVVVSSQNFIRDDIALASVPALLGERLVMMPRYPANTDFFLNTLYWLSNDADRIAAGPRRGELPVLSKLNEAKAAALPYFLVGGWPAVALVAGLVVWLVRRK